MPRTVVIAPDSFKGSLCAADAARALAEGWLTTRPRDRVIALPMADGGEGTLGAIAAAVPGVDRVRVRAPGPDGSPVDAEWGLLPDGTAVVELASASGIELLRGLAPLTAHTRGFGRCIAAALDDPRTRRLVLAVGGSASTDAGLGALVELGARALDARGRPVPDGAEGLGVLARLDVAGLRKIPPGGTTVLTDVTVPLTGPRGAAVVFGPQKGASPEQVAWMDRALADANRVMRAALPGADPERPGAGAAGGTGYALMAWGATPRPGAKAVGALVGLPEAIAEADAVVTGEGRFDDQTATGKVAEHVRRLAAAHGVPCLLAAGQVAAEPSGYAAAAALADLGRGVEDALARPRELLREAGARLARV